MHLCRCCNYMQMEALARVTCGICLHNAAAGAAPGPPLLPPSAASQLPQAQHLLAAIQGAAAEAEAALVHYSSQQTAAAADSSSGAGPKLGSALFCCQAAVSLRRLAADLSGGISCCHALDEGVTAALAQVGMASTGPHVRQPNRASTQAFCTCPAASGGCVCI
jgi:hypothetical protein